jgi:alginate O-acetyltransferase complex protein AlgI
VNGAYLCINHAWNNYGPAIAPPFARPANIAAVILTFLCLVVAWVFFRADSLPAALHALSKMVDPTQIALGRSEIAYIAFIVVYAAIAWFCPANTQAIIGYDHEFIGSPEAGARPLRAVLG